MQKDMHMYLCMSACVLMYDCVHMSVSVCAGVCRCGCMCLCICACVYLSHAKNIKLVSLAYMQVTKSAKCESGTISVSICIHVCVHLSVCICIVCVVCQI